MSFDLSLAKGDLAIGYDGDIKKVRDTTKAAQDILKILHTPLGSDPFSLNLGTTLTTANIGELISVEFAQQRAAASINQSIQILQALQRSQQVYQTVTAGEKILGIARLNVTRNSEDPRQYDIDLAVITGAQTVLEIPSFSIITTD